MYHQRIKSAACGCIGSSSGREEAGGRALQGIQAKVAWGLVSKFGTDREMRRRRAETLYSLEMMFRAEDISDFVYDEEQDLFRFPEDGRFAFSREWADVRLLKERGYYGSGL